MEQAEAVAEQARRRLQIIGITPGTFGNESPCTRPSPASCWRLPWWRRVSKRPQRIINDHCRPQLSMGYFRRPGNGNPAGQGWRAFTIHLAAYPGETFRGRVTQVGDTVDPETRTVKVRAELPNPGGRFKPEMFGTIQLAEQTELRPVVPAAAVIATDRQTVIWREVGHGVFEKVAVTTGVQLGDRIAIVSGLKPNDRVVVDGVMLLVVNDALPTQEPSR